MARSVSFCESCDVLLVPSHTEMTDKEYRETWYNKDEYDCITRANIHTVRMGRKKNKNEPQHLVGHEEEEEHCCIRGLEAFICPKSLEQRKLAKDFVMSAVLCEQDRQRQIGVNKPEDIRKASMRTSVVSVHEALSFAACDASFAHRELVANARKIALTLRINLSKKQHCLSQPKGPEDTLKQVCGILGKTSCATAQRSSSTAASRAK